MNFASDYWKLGGSRETRTRIFEMVKYATFVLIPKYDGNVTTYAFAYLSCRLLHYVYAKSSDFAFIYNTFR